MPDDSSPTLRARLIEAALAALGRGEEVGLRAIARAVGVSAMTPYRHFADKAALLEAVVLRGFEDLRLALQAADDRPDPGEALVVQAEAYLAFARARPALFRLMFSKWDSTSPPVEGTAYGVMVRRVRQLRPLDPEAGILACWSAVHGMATLAIDGGLPTDNAACERAALSIVIDGLRSR